MSKEEQALQLLNALAEQAPVNRKIHADAYEAFMILKAAIEPKVVDLDEEKQ